MTQAERILAFLSERHGMWFDDDQLAAALDIRPRQTVNQICRRLVAQRAIRREKHGTKICNAVFDVRPTKPPEATAPTSRRRTEDSARPSPNGAASAALNACRDTLIGRKLDAAAAWLEPDGTRSDPRNALLACRGVLEMLLRSLGADLNHGLSEGINAWSGGQSEDTNVLRAHMHTVRTLGNAAAHGSMVRWDDVLVAAQALQVVAERVG